MITGLLYLFRFHNIFFIVAYTLKLAETGRRYIVTGYYLSIFVGARTDGHFYRAMLCIRGTSHGPVSVRLSVCLCLCLSQVGVLLKRLNVGSHKQHHTIAKGL